MATFKVLQNFTLPSEESIPESLRGTVYQAGDTISGVTAREARHLLSLAPAGTFEALDGEATTVVKATYEVNVGGTLPLSGEALTKKD